MTGKTQEREWHMDKKVMVGVITVLIINLLTSTMNVWYTTKTLTTEPPLPDRVSKLEWQMEGIGRTMTQLNDTLQSTNRVINRVAQEQARRTPMVDFIEREMKGSNGHNHGGK